MARRMMALVLILGTGLCCFGQPAALRDYVGLINQSFHPDIVAYLGKFRAEFERRGNTEAARGIDTYLKGGSGTGFVYVAPDGANYIITNHHVITQSYDISVTFEKQDGAKVTYEGLEIIAADEDMDIALLAFPGGGRPFTGGLAFLDRPVIEGESVYSAGFPGLGTTTLWQFGGGMVSNAQVRFPEDDRAGSRIMGPYIQHTAQVDPGNSGGPLLVQAPEFPTGYAVAGINTLSARFRQAANFSIPMDRVNAFLAAALGPKPADERPRLDARLDAFIAGLTESGPVYQHIAKYLSNTCTAENAEYALTEVLRNANRAAQDNIIRAFIYSPVEGMGYAVAWTIERALRTPSGRIAVSVDTVESGGDKGYTVTFTVNNGTISSGWVNDYGIWRISAFGDFAAGDKTLLGQQNRVERLRTGYLFQLSAGLAYPLELGPAFGADMKLRLGFMGYGLRLYTAGNPLFQAETTAGLYIPIRLHNVIGITPYGDLGFGVAIKESGSDDEGLLFGKDMGLVFSITGGLMLTSSAVPGLFLQAAYQHSFYTTEINSLRPGLLFFGLGYGF